MTRPLVGAVPVLATPFLPDGALDEASLRRLVRFQLDCGVSGVAVFGMAGEGFALGTHDRRRILAGVTEVVGSRVPVVAGVAATGAHPAVEQVEAAAEGGADMVMVLPPFLVKPAPPASVDFFAAVADAAAAAGVEVMVQDAPAATGVTLPTATLLEICRHPAVTAAKIEAPPTAAKVLALVEALDVEGEPAAVLGGQNALFLPEELRAGATATMPACEFADRLPPVLEAAGRGDWASARRTHDPLLPLVRHGMQPGLAWAAHKHVLVRRGVIEHATVRSPAADLDAASAAALDGVLDDLDLPRWDGGS